MYSGSGSITMFMSSTNNYKLNQLLVTHMLQFSVHTNINTTTLTRKSSCQRFSVLAGTLTVRRATTNYSRPIGIKIRYRVPIVDGRMNDKTKLMIYQLTFCILKLMSLEK